MALDVYIEAEYADGYIHREDEDDQSHWSDGHNIFYDILNRLPEEQHGKMVRWTLVAWNSRVDYDTTDWPETARPIRFNCKSATLHPDGQVDLAHHFVDFGYQYTDENGKNVQFVERIHP